MAQIDRDGRGKFIAPYLLLSGNNRYSTLRIDVAVALIMALDRCIRNEGGGGKSVYEERGLIFF